MRGRPFLLLYASVSVSCQQNTHETTSGKLYIYFDEEET